MAPGITLLKPHQLSTPIRVNNLKPLLFGYDPVKTQFLVEGLTVGFRIHSAVQNSIVEATNLLSAKANPEVVENKLQKELEADRISGPFDRPPLPNLIVPLWEWFQRKRGSTE